MGDRKPPVLPSRLSHLPLGRGRGDSRLDTLQPRTPQSTLVTSKGTQKPQFAPIVPPPKIKKEEPASDIDSKLREKIPLELLNVNNIKVPRAFNKPKVPAGRGDIKPGLVAPSPFAQGPSSSSNSSTWKKRGEQGGNILDVADAFSNKKKEQEKIDAANVHHPTKLPFEDPRTKDDDVRMEDANVADPEDDASGPNALVSSEFIPTPLMSPSGEFLNENNYFFIQLPSSLPFVPPPIQKTTMDLITSPNPAGNPVSKPAPGTAPGAAPTATPRPAGPPRTEFVNTLRGVSGHLGKIVFYKSGKVKLRIGDFLYDVNAANNPNFKEELMILNETSCYRVSAMQQHLIVTPDIEHLLNNMEV